MIVFFNVGRLCSLVTGALTVWAESSAFFTGAPVIGIATNVGRQLPPSVRSAFVENSPGFRWHDTLGGEQAAGEAKPPPPPFG